MALLSNLDGVSLERLILRFISFELHLLSPRFNGLSHYCPVDMSCVCFLINSPWTGKEKTHLAVKPKLGWWDLRILQRQ
jgi:hypothetical protein